MCIPVEQGISKNKTKQNKRARTLFKKNNQEHLQQINGIRKGRWGNCYTLNES